jgi:hypothetical protein
MTRSASLLFAAALLAAAGCTDPKATPGPNQTSTSTVATAKTSDATLTPATTEKSEEDTIRENLAKLSPEDRAIAEKQKYCVEESDERLGGAMGVPIKLIIKGETVFICCGGCKKNALKDPDKTLAKAKELREKNAKDSKDAKK